MPLLYVLTQNLSSELWITFSSVNQSLNFHLSHQLKISQTDLQIISRIKLLTSVQWYLRNKKQDDYDYEPPSVNTPNLISFDTLCPVTVEEICKTIMCCPTTSCVLDPLPKQSLTTNVDNLITCYHTNSQFISNHWKISFFTKISNNNTIAKEGPTRSGIIEKLSSCV